MADCTIVDTDILIDVGRGVGEAIAYPERLETNSQLAISAVTQMELIVGCRNKNELHDLEKFLNRFQLFKIGEAVSDQATALLRQYRLSHGLLIADALIAATALVENSPLVSKNQRDYGFIDDLNLLPYPA
jgi:predicted nucleic acid-binding protein